ncbi:MAG: SiaB family protein kinase [Bacteroidetes bacterium]|nr:SiaB family protein kinase [Bacteroidota bacterium]MBU1718829.1 SiaB family protein kinase [Bacteroidota bacterium]
MIDKRVILVYNGYIKFETIEILLSKVKSELNGLEIEKLVKKRIFNIMVECIENIHKYTEWVKDRGSADPAFNAKIIIEALELEDNAFVITAGNPILAVAVDGLKKRIDTVNKMNRKKLKKHYKLAIESSEINPKGGAGLGIIDIALKSGNRLDYYFEQISDDVYYYTLKIKVSNIESD